MFDYVDILTSFTRPSSASLRRRTRRAHATEKFRHALDGIEYDFGILRFYNVYSVREDGFL